MDDIFRSYIVPAIISGIISVTTAIVGGYMLRNNLRGQLEVNYITDKRLAWIKELRTVMSEYMSVVYDIINAKEMDGQITKEMLGNLNRQAFYLILLLNYSGKLDKLIIDIVNRINNAIEEGKLTNIKENIEILVSCSQVYAKMEWGRSRTETKGKKYVNMEIQKEIERLYNKTYG